MKVWRKKTLEKTCKIQKYSYIFTRKTSKKQCRMSLLINNKQNHPWWMKHVYIIKLYFLLISCSKKVCQFFFCFSIFFSLFVFSDDFNMTSNNFNNGNNSDSLRLQQIDCSSAAGAPTLTTPTLTPTTLRNIGKNFSKISWVFFSWNIFKSCPLQFVSLPLEQMFLEASGNGNNLEQPVIHENAAHFVPPPIAMELPPPLPGPTSVEVPPPLPGNI